MSAFCDIWIGADSPVGVRKGNAAWAEYGNGVRYFLSKPGTHKDAFVDITSEGAYTMAVLGQFYETVDRSKLLQNCLSFIDKKDVGFDDPAGHYILFLFNNHSKEYHVFTNRFGTYHAYWLNDGNTNGIGTYFLGMARQSQNKALDWEGISGFFGMGFFPGTTTYLKSIQILSPASYYHFDTSMNLVTIHKYWNWTIASTIDSESDHFNALNAAIGKCLTHAVTGHKVALPLSGGLDSRMLAGIVTKAELRCKSLWSYSYGYNKTSPENSIASRIARAREIPFRSSVVPNYLFEQLSGISEAVELFQYVDGTRQAYMRDEIASNADVVIGGHWGDVWMDSMSLTGSSDLISAFEKKVLKRGRQWLLSEVAENFQKNPASYLKDYFDSSIKQYDHLESPNLRFKAYKTDHWSFRWTLASIRMYQAAAFPVLPFYDKNVADLLLSVPDAKLSGRKIQIDYIKKYHPDLANITWQEYGRNLYSYRCFNNRNLVYRAAKKFQRMAKGQSIITRNWEVFYMNPEGRKNLEMHLLENRVLNDLVDREKIVQLINDLYRNPSAANGYTISMLLTFATALKQIFS